MSCVADANPIDPAPIEDEDTKAAFLNAFKADIWLVDSCPGGLRTGAIVSDVVIGSTPATASPYARVECEQGPRANEFRAPVEVGQKYHDFRRVMIDVYGVRADVIVAMGHMRRVFEWQPKASVERTGNVKPMTVPNAGLKCVRPLPGSGKLEEQKERVQGGPVWKGTLLFEVWTEREIP